MTYVNFTVFGFIGIYSIARHDWNYIFPSQFLKKCELAEHHAAVMKRHPSPIHNPLGMDLSLKTIWGEGLRLHAPCGAKSKKRRGISSIMISISLILPCLSTHFFTEKVKQFAEWTEKSENFHKLEDTNLGLST